MDVNVRAPDLARPAATVVVAREYENGFEVLMLKRSKVGAFAGMWVFPGGKVDEADAGDDEIVQARSAAAREAMEEVALAIDPGDLITLSHWTPPSNARNRYATWFFVAPWLGGDITIDDHEIVGSRWISPADAVAADLPMAPPTAITLATLADAQTFEGLKTLVLRRGVERFETVPARLGEKLVLLWHGDAGYESADATMAGERHRMTISSTSLSDCTASSISSYERTIGG